MKQAETGTPVAEVIRRMGISEQTFYRWKKLYGGLGVSELRRLKRLVADLSLDKHILQDVLSKKVRGLIGNARLPGTSSRAMRSVNGAAALYSPLAG
jgi:putative transposase